MKYVGGIPTSHALADNILGTALANFKISLFDLNRGMVRLF